MKRSRFSVPKMDCAAEEQMVRGALGDLEGIAQLKFDLPARQVDVFHSVEVEQISTRLAKLGLGASLADTVQVEEGAVPKASPDQDSKSRRTLILLLCINGVMFGAEFTAGLIASSAGLIADSLDMLADAAVYGLSLYAVGRSSKHKLRAAHLSGWVQLGLGCWVLVEVVRRYFVGAEPEPTWMMAVAFVALLANVTCLWLISSERGSGAHMQASWIFSSNDVIANAGVIIAGGLVAWTGSRTPDLIIGAIIATVVVSGAIRILRLR